MAGLAAAHRLVARGREVIVLEARERIGGRIWTLHVPDLVAPVELGAEFLHAEADETRRIARRAGLTIVDIDGQRWMSHAGELRHADFMKKVERILRKFRDDRPRDQSVAEALSSFRSLSATDRRLAVEFVEGFHAADVERISEASLAGSTDDPNALRTARVNGGYGAFVRAVSASVMDRIQLDHVVRRITWRRGEAVIASETRTGTALPAIVTGKVIVTLPLGVLKSAPGSAGYVEFDPAVAAIDSAVNKLEMGGVVRVALQFDERFWMTDRFSTAQGGAQFNDMSFVQSLDQVPFPVWWTPYPVEAPLLIGWTGGPSAWNMTRDGSDVVDAAIGSLAKVLGVSRSTVARHLRGSFHHDWLNDPFSRGTYSYVAVGGSGAAAVLARPIEGTLFFAGEHASSGRNGTVDGAIASGFRAADQVLRSTSH